jgi:hypothetical protein
MLIAAATLACSNKQPPPALVKRAVQSAPDLAPDPAATAKIATCGTQGMPDCPLQNWMDHRLNGPFSRDEFPTLIQSFRDLAAVAPIGFSGWGAWAEGGAAAAERQDHAGIHKACTGCHDGYRERYRQSMRERPVPASDPP